MNCMRKFWNIGAENTLTEETATDMLYDKPGVFGVTVISERKKLPEDVIGRLLKKSGLDGITVANIEKESSVQRQNPENITDPDELAERYAEGIIGCVQQAIGATAMSNEREARVLVGELDGGDEVTGRAIQFAAAALQSVDPGITVHGYERINPLDMTAIDVRW